MGKKKPQKTKEISVAIAEASSTGDETQKEEQTLVQTPRKRGRPRKIIEKIAGSEEAKEEDVGNQSKKAKMSEVEEKKQQLETKGGEEKVKSEEKELPRRSSRRKSKPRKSS